MAAHHLDAAEPESAVAAAQVALMAGSTADTALLDAATGYHAAGNRKEGAAYVARVMSNHDAEVEEDLPPLTFEILRQRGWLSRAS